MAQDCGATEQSGGVGQLCSFCMGWPGIKCCFASWPSQPGAIFMSSPEDRKWSPSPSTARWSPLLTSVFAHPPELRQGFASLLVTCSICCVSDAHWAVHKSLLRWADVFKRESWERRASGRNQVTKWTFRKGPFRGKKVYLKQLE